MAYQGVSEQAKLVPDIVLNYNDNKSVDKESSANMRYVWW